MRSAVLGLVFAAAPAPTVEIAPGVHMPMVNLGIGNVSGWAALGGRGYDTALTYGDAQVVTGAAVRAALAAGFPREELFVTTKIPCCPAIADHPKNFNVGVWKKFCEDKSYSVDATAAMDADLQRLGLDYADLTLLHWPCETPAQSAVFYQGLEAARKA